MTTLLNNNKDTANTDVPALSEEETKLYLTPFAFKMDKSLFGLPLASPTKRGIALLIDMALIAMLSDVSGVALALAIAITLYYLGNKKRAKARGKQKGHKRRAIMRFIAAFMVFIILLDTLPPLLKYMSGEQNEPQVSVEDNPLSLAQSLTLAGIALSTMQTIGDSDCQTVNCWQIQLDSAATNMAGIVYEGDIEITESQLVDIFSDIGEDIELPTNEQDRLISSMHDSYNKEFLNLVTEGKRDSSNKSIAEPSELEQDERILTDQKKESVFVLGENGKLTDVDQLKQKETNDKPVYSIIEWVKGIIEDLGLGFGWATFYFTAFIALGKGQTLGKKLLGIKVLQLDGTPLSLWDSFERYGGYGAGLATGLLGFIQIYWDPNKQAIHDRISATVVIDLRKSRFSNSIMESNTNEK